MKKFIIIFLLFNSYIINAQSKVNFKLKGKIVNSQTGETIPFCSIVIDNTFKGTSSNEDGEFIIEIEKLPTVLVFQHIGYAPVKVTINENKVILIKVDPFVNALDEVVVESNSKNNYAFDLAKKAFTKLRNQIENIKYGKALYRQKSKNDSVYTELSEIIFDTKYTLTGIEEWDIIEGRYALKKEKVNNKNFTLLTETIKSIQPDAKDIIFPLSESIEKFYKVRFIETIKSINGDVALLRFIPINKKFAAFESDVYISKENYNVLKIVSTIDDDRLDLVQFNEENISKKNYHLDYEMVFKEIKSLGLVLDYIKLNQEFDYFEGGILKTKVSTMSNFTFFEYDAAANKARLGRQFNKGKSDWEKLNEIGYNKKFWEENPIIRRTPVEKEIIDNFERDNAFESIYINSRNQISYNPKSLLDDPFINSFSKDIKDYNNANPIEKVYLHTDKNVYFSGENIWFSAYTLLTDNSEQLLSSSMLYVDILDTNGKIIFTQKNKLVDGRAIGNIRLPINLELGSYTLRGYTPWMKNFNQTYFFSKKLKILSKTNTRVEATTDDTAVSFFPEGGHLVADINGKVAFKAIGDNGLGKKTSGKIINSKNEHITNFTTIYNGMGYFYFTPELDENYKAITEEGVSYKLPKIKTSGYVMSANNISDRSVLVKIFASKELRNKPIYVIGLNENKKYFQGKYDFGGNDFVEVEIPKNKLPSGVFTITVLDQDLLPYCERVVFVNNQDELIIKTKINKKRLKPNKEIMIDVLVTDPNGNPVVADLSIAVTDSRIVNKNEYASNIYTNFLLESDLKGHIENPYELFKDNERSTKQKLDLVMLANGWRKLRLKRNDNIENKEISLSQGINFAGRLIDSKNNNLKNTNVTVIAKSNDNIKMYNTKTDSNGLLFLKDIYEIGKVELIFNTLDNKGDLIDGVQVIPVNQKQSITNFTDIDSDVLDENMLLTSYEKAYIFNIDSDASFFSDEKSIRLNEVVLDGENKKKEESLEEQAESIFGIEPDAVVYNDDHRISEITDLLHLVPGIRISGDNKLSMRGSTPLYVIDGVPLSAVERPRAMDEKLNGEPIPEQVLALNIYNIERVEVLKGPKAAVYGSRGGNGIILFYSKRTIKNNNREVKPPSHIIEGFSVSREFYSPKYNIKQENIKKDRRSTLYWSPSIITNKRGRASIKFFNSDIAEEIQINIEGMSLFGYPGSYISSVTDK